MKIHPVFRHFFYGRFLDPFDWRSRILDYTISLARWSVGIFFILINCDCCGFSYQQKYDKNMILFPEKSASWFLKKEMLQIYCVAEWSGCFQSCWCNSSITVVLLQWDMWLVWVIVI